MNLFKVMETLTCITRTISERVPGAHHELDYLMDYLMDQFIQTKDFCEKHHTFYIGRTIFEIKRKGYDKFVMENDFIHMVVTRKMIEWFKMNRKFMKDEE